MHVSIQLHAPAALFSEKNIWPSSVDFHHLGMSHPRVVDGRDGL